ncbi:Signal peptidase I T [subsurface metagenome]
MKTILRDVLITLAIALAIFFILRTTVQAYKVIETCMEPNYVEGEWLLASKATYWFHEPERGDVIILDPPFETEEVYIKRLIALPGDTVEVKDGAVYINGTALEEPYIMEAPAYTFSPTELGEDEYFVLGDNRNNANDSHSGWTISRDAIIGKAWFSYWPISEWGGANNYPLAEQLEAATE